MDIPIAILNNFRRKKQIGKPTTSLRAISDLKNNLGETYILGDKKSIMLYSGKFGESKDQLDLGLEEVVDLDVEKADPFAFLKLKTNDDEYKMKFPVFALNKLYQVIDEWDDYIEHPNAADNAEEIGAVEHHDKPDDAKKLTPIVGFSAVLHAMVYIDNDAASEELKNLHLIVKDDAIIEDGLNYWQRKGSSELIIELGSCLSSIQKQSLLANIIEVSMIDGELNTDEQEFLRYICKQFDISQEDFDSIFSILLLKNNLGVFYESDEVE